jgi:RNA polymerase sigma-70 factor, ECF subfamily
VPLERYEFDRGYIERLVAADAETERHFTRYFGDLLTLKLRARLRSAAQVDDAKQETFVRVLATLKKKGGIASPEALGAFVNSVCNNVLLEGYRSGSRVTALDEEYDGPDERVPGAESTLLASEERAKVREALAGLPAKDRELLRLLFFEERDKDAVCEALNVDRNYLRVLLHRAKGHFRDRWSEENP